MKNNDVNRQVSPRAQDDFFSHINQTWLDNNPIPDSESSWGTFYVLRDNSWKAVNDIVDGIRKADRSSLSSEQGLLRDFFDSAMNFADNSDTHLNTLGDEIKKIDAIDSPESLAHYLGYAHRLSLNMFWGLYIDLDDKDSKLQVLRTHQAGIALPNRDYYLEDSDDMKKIRDAYRQYQQSLKDTLACLANCDLESAFEIENKLAESSWKNVELRDVSKNYNRFTMALLKKTYGNFDWDSYFKGLQWQEPTDNLIVSQPSFIRSCLEILDSQPLAAIKSYMIWRLVDGFAGWIDQSTFDIAFDFYGKVVDGTSVPKPLWKRSVTSADRYVIGESLGKEYTSIHFPETSKNEVLELVEDIRKAYHNRIDKLKWMNDATKELAHTKLDNIKVFIGYPSEWRSLDTLLLKPDNYIANSLTLREFDAVDDIAKIGKPPKDEEWEMNAHTVNAYHHPNRLEIVFPAAILQPPFFSPNADYATNLGGIGAVIGHEFTHGFDDQGSQFDANGNVNDWQSDEERKAFAKMAKLIVDQANAFETVPGTFLQGDLILGEAIADIGGLQLAVEALEASQSNNHDYKALFANFAKAECGHATRERLVQLAKIDPHPPSRFRVNNVVNHIDRFYDEYGVKTSDSLYLSPNKRAQIW